MRGGNADRERSGRIDSTQNNNNNNNINHALGKREEKTVKKSGIPVSFFFVYFTLYICTLRKKGEPLLGGEKRRAREEERIKWRPSALLPRRGGTLTLASTEFREYNNSIFAIVLICFFFPF